MSDKGFLECSKCGEYQTIHNDSCSHCGASNSSLVIRTDDDSDPRKSVYWNSDNPDPRVAMDVLYGEERQ